MKRLRPGFTLIELMMVIVIIGLLAAIAIPKFGESIRNANEGATKGKLARLRSALSMYFADFEGNYPADLTMMMVPGKYYAKALPFYLANHDSANAVVLYAAFDGEADGAAWGYVNAGAQWGRVWVQCTHADSRGSVWTSY